MDFHITAVVLCLFVASILGTYGLEFHLNKTFVCGQLVCQADADLSNPSVLTVIQMDIYDAKLKSTALKLATISALTQTIYIDDAIKNSINVEGNISDYHAHLQIGFKNQSYCTSGSFMCQLTYVNHAGHLDVMQSPEIHANSESTSNIVTSGDSIDVMNAIGQLNNSIENVESVLGTGETTVDVTVQQLKNLTSLLTQVMANSQGTNPDNNQGIYQHIGTLDDCYKGMASINTPDRALITVPGSGDALCDTTTDGGGWVVFQKRATGNEDFERDWSNYRSGFGNVSTDDYWLGLEAVHRLTFNRSTELRIDMESRGDNYHAVYSSFHLTAETDNYRLMVGRFTGNAGDRLSYHNNMLYSTQDVDNDNSGDNCAETYHGGWWYFSCTTVHLNSLYGVTGSEGIYWQGVQQPITFTEMKLRFTN